MKNSDFLQQPTLATGLPVVFGTGLIALDLIVNAAAAGEPALAAGGTCGNVLAILSYLGWAAFPVARLNGDAAAEIVRADFRRWGVSLDFAAQAPATATPIIIQTIRRDRHGSPIHRFSLVCPVCGAWFPSFRAITRAAAYDLVATLAGKAPADFKPRVFYFDRVSRGALILAAAFAERGAVVMFEPASVGDPKLFDEALSIAQILKYSRERLPSLASRQPSLPSLFLEIETLGSQGLRYRSSLLSSQGWHTLAAIRAPQVVDTAGAGDWCTAGLLSRLAACGARGLAGLRARDIVAGLRYGQAAAAVTCCFEGARGAMYELSKGQFSQTIASLLVTENKLDLDRRGSRPARVLSKGKPECCATVEEGSEERFAEDRRDARSPGRQSPVGSLCPMCD